ncbi:MAG: sensor histidine kinase [Clostridiales bacterium]|nr:sensor histidine kinase [Clostridiales bacterium]
MDITSNVNYNGDERGIRSLVSILTDLTDNAIKYSDDEGLIIISLTNSSRHITLSVYNTADNIDVENVNMLFERFYRGDTSYNSQKEGYGIGLSIAKSVAENHRGKISVKSEDGKSIEFTVKL